MIQAICRVDHSPEGARADAVVATFDSMQDASNRQIEDSYPNCIIEYMAVSTSTESDPRSTSGGRDHG